MAVSSTARLFASSSRRLAPSAVHSAETVDDKFKDTAVLSLSRPPITTALTFLSFPELHVKKKSRTARYSSLFGFGFRAKTTSYGFTRLGTTAVATALRHIAEGHLNTTCCVCDWFQDAILALFGPSNYSVFTLYVSTRTTFNPRPLSTVYTKVPGQHNWLTPGHYFQCMC